MKKMMKPTKSASSQAMMLSSLRQRHAGKGVSPAAVIARARKWAQAHNDQVVMAACARAERQDKAKKR